MKRTREEAEKTRQDILDAGLLVFGEKGIETARVEDIALKAGVTRGAFYHHFKNKYDLYIELLELRAQYYTKLIHENLEGKDVSILRIRSYMLSVLKKAARDKKFRALNEMIMHKSEKIEKMLNRMERNKSERLIPTRPFIDTVDGGKEFGDIYKKTSTGFAVMSIYIFLNGAIVFSMLNKDRFSLEDKAEGLVDTFLLGFAAERP